MTQWVKVLVTQAWGPEFNEFNTWNLHKGIKRELTPTWHDTHPVMMVAEKE